MGATGDGGGGRWQAPAGRRKDRRWSLGRMGPADERGKTLGNAVGAGLGARAAAGPGKGYQPRVREWEAQYFRR
jgi:hypothetical protein